MTAAWGAGARWAGQRWRPVFEWLVGLSHAESRELRRARLGTLPDEWIVVLAAVVWSQAGGWYTLALSGRPWVLLWIVADAVLQGIRVRLKVVYQRAVATQQRAPHRAMVLAGILWFGVTAAGIVAMSLFDDSRLFVLAPILAVGFIGYVASRYAAFPRLGAAVIYLLGAAVSLGLLLSPTMWIIGVLMPGGPVAFHLLLRQNHAILIEALAAQEQHLRLSLQDPLTELPNRLALWQTMGRLLAELDRDESFTFAVLCLDLDGFKPVNDRYGHSSGDWLLKSIAGRLRDGVREDDLVCRIGGDEFVVVLPGADKEAAVGIAERLIGGCTQPHDLGGAGMVRVGVSIGIALAPQHGRTTDELLSHADAALYTSKRTKKGAWTVHSAAL